MNQPKSCLFWETPDTLTEDITAPGRTNGTTTGTGRASAAGHNGRRLCRSGPAHAHALGLAWPGNMDAATATVYTQHCAPWLHLLELAYDQRGKEKTGYFPTKSLDTNKAAKPQVLWHPTGSNVEWREDRGLRARFCYHGRTPTSY